MQVVDMHCDTISELYERRKAGEKETLLHNRLMLDLERMEQGGYALQNFALFVDLKHHHEEPFLYCMELADTFFRELADQGGRIGIVRSWSEIEANLNAGRMSALLTVEEGGVCQGRLALLHTLYRLGVRMMPLTWTYPNELAWPGWRIREADGTFSWQAETERGLTPLGEEFVAEMERLGMMIDLSHLGDAAIWDVLRLTRRPLVASHSNARALSPHPRNLTDAMIRRIAERGGVIGINYYSAFLRNDWRGEPECGRIADMLAHMRHLKQVGGIGCIGLGSDFDGVPTPIELGDAAGLPRLAQAMEQDGFTGKEIEAVFGGNVLRLYRELL